MADPSLAYAFGLAPEAAIDWFRGKGYSIGWDWRAVALMTRGYVFSVAGVARADVLATIRGEIDRALAEGTTFDEFKRQLRARLTTLGWWGPQQVVRVDTGETKVVNLSSPRRLETIYRTNLQSAYMAGRYRAMWEERERRPFWEYVAVMDDRTRPTHAAMHGKVFRADDPVWNYITPPNGFGCRCRIRSLTEADVRARGIAVMRSEGRLDFEQVPGTNGALDERVVVDLGGGRSFSPDRGFGLNPALSAPYPDMVMPDRLAVLGAARDEALATFATADQRLKAFGAWLDEVRIDGRRPQHSKYVVGYLDENAREAAASKGLAASSWPIEIEERIASGKKEGKHRASGIALDDAQWRDLPGLLASRRALVWHQHEQLLMYVLPDTDPEWRILVAVRIGFTDRGRKTNAVRSVRRIRAEHVLDDGGAVAWGVV